MKCRLHDDGHASTLSWALCAFVLFLLFLLTPRFVLSAEIHDAVKSGDLATARSLLKGKSKEVANAAMKGGITPLHIAAILDKAEMASLLLAKGANVNATTDTGFTPLHYVALKGAEETAAILVKQRRRKLSVPARGGITPLHIAAKKNSAAIARILVLAGANVEAKTDKGETAADWARKIGAKEALQEILASSELMRIRAMEAKRNAGVRKLQEDEQRPFDKDGNGDVDHNLLKEYVKARHERRVTEQSGILESLAARLDANKDGKISRGEASGILADFQKLDALPDRNKEYSLMRRELYLKHFDNNDDGVISDVENEIAYAFLRESRVRRPATNPISITIAWPQL